jgi:hypothetical protein
MAKINVKNIEVTVIHFQESNKESGKPENL